MIRLNLLRNYSRIMLRSKLSCFHSLFLSVFMILHLCGRVHLPVVLDSYCSLLKFHMFFLLDACELKQASAIRANEKDNSHVLQWKGSRIKIPTMRSKMFKKFIQDPHLHESYQRFQQLMCSNLFNKRWPRSD